MSDIENNEFEDQENEDQGGLHDVVPVSGMYENWFLDYASYVILERAVPAIMDGFKPVQRRIMHSMKEMDDGRFNKVANVIGHTMQYHPHGDAAIGAAMVNMGQKELLIETQGNWGDVRTGDGAAAPRYIEARLSKFAHAVVFNPQTTEWQVSYDGRKREPVHLPVKFPLLLAQGVEGIAVGLATKIMPHNFIELCEASIKVLQGKRVKIYPDFLTGGQADFENYNDGLKGGKIRLRSNIEIVDKKTLKICDVAYGVTTNTLIDSIIKANDNGKIKIKKVVDNTAAELEVLVTLAPNISPDVTIDALYAFTDCEISISPNCCVIIEEKPVFLGVSEILKVCTDSTVALLNRELEIRKSELLEKLLFSSLEKIFIQEEMYIDFKNYTNKPELFEYLDGRFEKFKPQFYREIGDDDFEKLTQIPMIRITRFDSDKADEKMRGLQEELDQVNHNLANLIEYAIDFYQNLKDKFGKGRERRTEIRTFENIKATSVAVANAKLYVNRSEGFIGTGIKKDEFVCDCSDIDNIIVFRKDGKMIVTKISDKVFVGKDIIYAGVWKKNDERMVYNLAYLEAGSGASMVKRFQVLGITRDKEYDLTKGVKKSKLLYFSANANGEAEIVTAYLTAGSPAKKKVFDFDFADLAIKGRGSQGNRLTKYPVRKVELKSKGVSTLSGVDIWYDETVGRLNRDERGRYLGEFNGDDCIVVVNKKGEYEITGFQLTNRYEPKDILAMSKLTDDTVISAVHLDGASGVHYVKRFKVETTTIGKKFLFISEAEGSKLIVASTNKDPRILLSHKDGKKPKEDSEISLVSMIEVKGWKANGNKLTGDKVLKVTLLDKPDVPVRKSEVKEEEVEAKESETTPAESKQKKEAPKAETKEVKPEAKDSAKKPAKDEDLNIGDTIDLSPKSPKKKDDDDDKEQLNLF